MSALETKFNALAGLDSAIPTYVAGAVGVATAHRGVPAAGDAGVAIVFPTDRPAADGASAGIGYAYGAGEARTPIIANHIGALTAATGWAGAGGFGAGWHRAGGK